MGLRQPHWAPATCGGQQPRTARPRPELTAGLGALQGFPGLRVPSSWGAEIPHTPPTCGPRSLDTGHGTCWG